MATKPVPIRFPEHTWELVQVEAQEQGMTGAEFVRAWALAGAIFSRARRGGPEVDAAVEMWEAARRAVLTDPRYGVR